MEKEWKQIGIIGVDAGICWIGDPCYIMHKNPTADKEHDKPPKAIGENWSDFCNKIEGNHQQFNYDMGHPGLGVLVGTGYGDGTYKVFAQFVDKRISAVKVVFIDD